MKKTCIRLLSALLAVCLLGAAVPPSGFLSLGLFNQAKALGNGDTVLFGTYPQSRVTDEALIAELDKAPKKWKSYGYYSGGDSTDSMIYDGSMEPSDFMVFSDFFYAGEKYRCVYFDSYRPYSTNLSADPLRLQKDYGYYTNYYYYFKYEPVTWRILDADAGLVLSELVLDAQPFQNTIYHDPDQESYQQYHYWQTVEQQILASNYPASSIRAWLNYDFYETAFSAAQKNNIRDDYIQNNKAHGDSLYDCEATNDPVFLLSYDEATLRKHGFDPLDFHEDAGRSAAGTNYALCQGLPTDTEETYGWGFAFWWLRTPGHSSLLAESVQPNGIVNTRRVQYLNGVRPACALKTLRSDETLSDTLFSDYNGTPEAYETVTGLFHGYVKSPTVGPSGLTYATEITVDSQSYRLQADVLFAEEAEKNLYKYVTATLRNGIVIEVKFFARPIFDENSYIADLWLDRHADLSPTPESELVGMLLDADPMSFTFDDGFKDNALFQSALAAWNGMQALFSPNELCGKNEALKRIYESLILDLLKMIENDALTENRYILQTLTDNAPQANEMCTEYLDLYDNISTLFGKDSDLSTIRTVLSNASSKKSMKFKEFLKNAVRETRNLSDNETSSRLSLFFEDVQSVLSVITSVDDFYRRVIAYVMVVNMYDEMCTVLKEMRGITNDPNFKNALDDVLASVGSVTMSALISVRELTGDLLTYVFSRFIDDVCCLLPGYNVLHLAQNVGAAFANLMFGTQGAVDAYRMLQVTREFTAANRAAIGRLANRYLATQKESDAAAYVYAMRIYQYVYVLDMENTISFAKKRVGRRTGG